MSNKRKGQTVACDEWAKHLRPDGRREFWKAQRQADKAIVASGDDASAPSMPAKKKARKRRRFVIEHRYVVPAGKPPRWPWEGIWRICGRYETAASRDEALRAMAKGANHCFSRPIPRDEFRAVDLKS